MATRLERREEARRRRNGLRLPTLRDVDDRLTLLPEDVPLHEEASVLEVDVGLVDRDDLVSPAPAVATEQDGGEDAGIETLAGFNEPLERLVVVVIGLRVRVDGSILIRHGMAAIRFHS